MSAAVPVAFLSPGLGFRRKRQTGSVLSIKDVEKSLKSKYLTQTYQTTSHTTWTVLNLSYLYALIAYK